MRRCLDQSAVTPAMQVKAWAVRWPSSHVTTSTACRKCRRAHDQQLSRKRTGFVASPETKSDQLHCFCPGQLRTHPALTQSFAKRYAFAVQFYDDPRHEKISTCTAITPVLAEKSGNKCRVKILSSTSI